MEKLLQRDSLHLFELLHLPGLDVLDRFYVRVRRDVLTFPLQFEPAQSILLIHGLIKLVSWLMYVFFDVDNFSSATAEIV